MEKNSDELIEKLGDDFYELKRLVIETPLGQFYAYSKKERAVGFTAKEALGNLLKLVNDRKTKGEVA
jgi:hypothetical protein